MGVVDNLENLMDKIRATIGMQIEARMWKRTALFVDAYGMLVPTKSGALDDIETRIN